MDGLSAYHMHAFAHSRCCPRRTQETVMTNKQRLIYSLLIALTVLAIMLGLTHLQNSGVLSEKTFQYIAISVAVVVVILNGILRRKVKR